MIGKVYIVWCRLNKNTRKFDLGAYVKKEMANEMLQRNMGMYSVWVSEYKLSKPTQEG